VTMKRSTRDEMVVVTVAKELVDGDRVFVGQGIAIVAAALAKVFYKREVLLLTEAGIVDFTPFRAPLHIADPTCTRGYAYNCDMVDIFSTILGGGYATVCFLGVAQVDRYGNVNSTCIGDYYHPTLRLMGAGGAPELLAYLPKTILTMRGGKFVEKLDYTTSPGHLEGGDSRVKAGLPANGGPQVLISAKGIFRFDRETKEMYLDALFPGATVEEVKAEVPWELKVAPELRPVELPTTEEIDFIRDFDPTIAMGRRMSFDLFAMAMKNFLSRGAAKPAAAEAAPGSGEEAKA